MAESTDFWDGFEAALTLFNIEVDKILSTCYNDNRTKDTVLDVKCVVKALEKMMPNDSGDLHLLGT